MAKSGDSLIHSINVKIRRFAMSYPTEKRPYLVFVRMTNCPSGTKFKIDFQSEVAEIDDRIVAIMRAIGAKACIVTRCRAMTERPIKTWQELMFAIGSQSHLLQYQVCIAP